MTIDIRALLWYNTSTVKEETETDKLKGVYNMIILTTSPAALISGLDREYPAKPIRVALYRAANDSECRDLQGVLYLEDYKYMTIPMLREWNDVPEAGSGDYAGERYNAEEFLAGCHIWGIDLNDNYDGEKCVTVYIYREGL